MRRLYLASSIDRTAESIAEDIGGDPGKTKLVFIDTAAEVETGDKEWLMNDRDGLKQAGFDMFDYTITGKSYKSIKSDLEDVDVIHVNGGNSFYLLLQARKSGFDTWVAEAVGGGKVYVGSSAGSMVISPDLQVASKSETKEFEKQLEDSKGIGLVEFLVFPHWGSNIFKDLYLKHRITIAYEPENKIVLLNDWQYVKVVDDMYKIVDVRDK